MQRLKLKHFLNFKKPTIHDVISLDIAQPVQNFSIHPKPSLHYFSKRYTRVKLTEHAFQRWNERVGPVMQDFSQLQQIFHSIFLLQRHRIQEVGHDSCLIDDEILVSYAITKNCLEILTLYGRVSLNPGLTSFLNLQHFKHRQNDSLSLAQPLEVLKQQSIPGIPSKCVYFSGQTNDYILEIYETNHVKKPIFTLTTKSDNSLESISFHEGNQNHLPNSVLYVLFVLGYGNFLYSYIRHHHSDRMANVLEYFTEKEVRDYFLQLQPCDLSTIVPKTKKISSSISY